MTSFRNETLDQPEEVLPADAGDDGATAADEARPKEVVTNTVDAVQAELAAREAAAPPGSTVQSPRDADEAEPRDELAGDDGTDDRIEGLPAPPPNGMPKIVGQEILDDETLAREKDRTDNGRTFAVGNAEGVTLQVIDTDDDRASGRSTVERTTHDDRVAFATASAGFAATNATIGPGLNRMNDTGRPAREADGSDAATGNAGTLDGEIVVTDVVATLRANDGKQNRHAPPDKLAAQTALVVEDRASRSGRGRDDAGGAEGTDADAADNIPAEGGSGSKPPDKHDTGGDPPEPGGEGDSERNESAGQSDRREPPQFLSRPEPRHAKVTETDTASDAPAKGDAPGLGSVEAADSASEQDEPRELWVSRDSLVDFAREHGNVKPQAAGHWARAIFDHAEHLELGGSSEVQLARRWVPHGDDPYAGHYEINAIQLLAAVDAGLIDEGTIIGLRDSGRQLTHDYIAHILPETSVDPPNPGDTADPEKIDRTSSPETPAVPEFVTKQDLVDWAKQNTDADDKVITNWSNTIIGYAARIGGRYSGRLDENELDLGSNWVPDPSDNRSGHWEVNFEKLDQAQSSGALRLHLRNIGPVTDELTQRFIEHYKPREQSPPFAEKYVDERFLRTFAQDVLHADGRAADKWASALMEHAKKVAEGADSPVDLKGRWVEGPKEYGGGHWELSANALWYAEAKNANYRVWITDYAQVGQMFSRRLTENLFPKGLPLDTAETREFRRPRDISEYDDQRVITGEAIRTFARDNGFSDAQAERAITSLFGPANWRFASFGFVDYQVLGMQAIDLKPSIASSTLSGEDKYGASLYEIKQVLEEDSLQHARNVTEDDIRFLTALANSYAELADLSPDEIRQAYEQTKIQTQEVPDIDYSMPANWEYQLQESNRSSADQSIFNASKEFPDGRRMLIDTRVRHSSFHEGPGRRIVVNVRVTGPDMGINTITFFEYTHTVDIHSNQDRQAENIQEDRERDAKFETEEVLRSLRRRAQSEITGTASQRPANENAIEVLRSTLGMGDYPLSGSLTRGEAESVIRDVLKAFHSSYNSSNPDAWNRNRRIQLAVAFASGISLEDIKQVYGFKSRGEVASELYKLYNWVTSHPEKIDLDPAREKLIRILESKYK